jgi:hypothetical protein
MHTKVQHPTTSNLAAALHCSLPGGRVVVVVVDIGSFPVFIVLRNGFSLLIFKLLISVIWGKEVADADGVTCYLKLCGCAAHVSHHSQCACVLVYLSIRNKKEETNQKVRPTKTQTPLGDRHPTPCGQAPKRKKNNAEPK